MAWPSTEYKEQSITIDVSIRKGGVFDGESIIYFYNFPLQIKIYTAIYDKLQYLFVLSKPVWARLLKNKANKRGQARDQVQHRPTYRAARRRGIVTAHCIALRQYDFVTHPGKRRPNRFVAVLIGQSDETMIRHNRTIKGVRTRYWQY